MSENYYFSKQNFKFGTEYNTLSRWRCKITVSDNIIIQRILMKKKHIWKLKKGAIFLFYLTRTAPTSVSYCFVRWETQVVNAIRYLCKWTSYKEDQQDK